MTTFDRVAKEIHDARQRLLTDGKEPVGLSLVLHPKEVMGIKHGAPREYIFDLCGQGRSDKMTLMGVELKEDRGQAQGRATLFHGKTAIRVFALAEAA